MQAWRIYEKKCNSMVDLSKFTSNKIYIYIYIEWSCSFNLQSSLLQNFIQNLIMLSLKKFRVVTYFFRSKKIIKFLNFINNNDFFFPSQGGPLTTLALTWSSPWLRLCLVRRKRKEGKGREAKIRWEENMCLHVKEKRNKRNRLYFTLLSNLFIKK